MEVTYFFVWFSYFSTAFGSLSRSYFIHVVCRPPFKCHRRWLMYLLTRIPAFFAPSLISFPIFRASKAVEAVSRTKRSEHQLSLWLCAFVPGSSMHCSINTASLSLCSSWELNSKQQTLVPFSTKKLYSRFCKWALQHEKHGRHPNESTTLENHTQNLLSRMSIRWLFWTTLLFCVTIKIVILTNYFQLCLSYWKFRILDWL